MTFVGQFKDGWKGYFRATLPYYFCAGLLFVLGVGFGALAVNALSAAQKVELVDYLEVFLRGLAGKIGDIDEAVVLRQSATANLKTAGLVWLFGATVIGAPLTVVLVFVRGFVVGFSAGFLFSEMGGRGIALTLLGILPQSAIGIPVLLALAVSSLGFSVLVVRRRVGRFQVNLAEEFLAYTFTCLVLTGALMGASLIEAYVTPFLMGLVATA